MKYPNTKKDNPNVKVVNGILVDGIPYSRKGFELKLTDEQLETLNDKIDRILQRRIGVYKVDMQKGGAYIDFTFGLDLVTGMYHFSVAAARVQPNTRIGAKVVRGRINKMNAFDRKHNDAVRRVKEESVSVTSLLTDGK